MKSYLLKWALASLLIPGAIALTSQLISVPDYLMLSLWPSSIVLMALDTNQPPEAWNALYIWSVSIALNVILYIAVGLLLRLLSGAIKRTNAENS